jgi:hypothetical protein
MAGQTRWQHVDNYAQLRQHWLVLHFTSLCNEPKQQKKINNGSHLPCSPGLIQSMISLSARTALTGTTPAPSALPRIWRIDIHCEISKLQLLPKSKWKSHPPGSPVVRKGDEQKYTYHHIRSYVFPVTCQHFACSSYACLDLIINHQNVVPRTEVSNRFQIAIWWEYYLQKFAIA